jgi:hypothetical protein
MLNNVIVHPTSGGYCGTTTALCITSSNGSARASIESVIHKADPARGIPQTVIDGNVYSNGTGTIIATAIGKYSSNPAFTSAMAATPVTIPNLDVRGKHGSSWVNADGSPTASLAAAHQEAAPIPVNPEINQYLPAGTRWYGQLG